MVRSVFNTLQQHPRREVTFSPTDDPVIGEACSGSLVTTELRDPPWEVATARSAQIKEMRIRN